MTGVPTKDAGCYSCCIIMPRVYVHLGIVRQIQYAFQFFREVFEKINSIILLKILKIFFCQKTKREPGLILWTGPWHAVCTNKNQNLPYLTTSLLQSTLYIICSASCNFKLFGIMVISSEFNNSYTDTADLTEVQNDFIHHWHCRGG